MIAHYDPLVIVIRHRFPLPAPPSGSRIKNPIVHMEDTTVSCYECAFVQWCVVSKTASGNEVYVKTDISDPFLGKTLAGKFRIIDFIGQGGMGTVYLAEHETLPRRFAIKILKNDYLTNELFVERFRREAIAASRVVHPNVVYITDFGRLPEGNFYIVMEFLEGTGLDKLLDSQGRIPLSRALPILIQVADALDHMHKMGVIHRDLKAENVLLVEERNRIDVVKILDFGIARLMVPDCTNSRITAHGQVFGTPEYMSPEQASDKPLDGRSDIYALGILAFELVTGQPPFVSEKSSDVLHAHIAQMPPAPSSLVPDQLIPRLFDGVVLRCLAKKPTERYATAGEVRAELMRVQTVLLNMAAHMAQTAEEVRKENQIPTGPRPALAADNPMSFIEMRSIAHETLVELTLRLVEAGLLDISYSRFVDKIMQLENEISSLSAAIAFREQEFEQIRAEYARQENILKYLIMDTSQEIDALTSSVENDKTQYEKILADLRGRLATLQVEKREKIINLNRELEQIRRMNEEKEQQSAALYGKILRTVTIVRQNDVRALQLKFGVLFEKLDRVRMTINQMRQQTGV